MPPLARFLRDLQVLLLNLLLFFGVLYVQFSAESSLEDLQQIVCRCQAHRVWQTDGVLVSHTVAKHGSPHSFPRRARTVGRGYPA